MVLSIPVGGKRRLWLSLNRGGVSVFVQKRRFELGEDEPPDDGGGAGVREPRRPIVPLRGGAVALPPDETL